MAEFKTRLKELRTSKGLSQQAVAEHFIVTQQSIYKYEHGLSEPDILMLIDMADFFDVSVDYLVGRSDIPAHYEQITITETITQPERRLLEYYRRLSQRSQEAVQVLIDEQSETES